jgi:hypothetical protein
MLCAKYVGNSWYNLNRVLVAFRSHFAVMEQNQDGQVVGVSQLIELADGDSNCQASARSSTKCGLGINHYI